MIQTKRHHQKGANNKNNNRMYNKFFSILLIIAASEVALSNAKSKHHDLSKRPSLIQLVEPSASSSSTTTSTSTTTTTTSTAAAFHRRQSRSILDIPRSGATPRTNSNHKKVEKSTSVSSSTAEIPPAPLSPIKKINPHFAVLYGMILAFNSGLLNGVTLSGVLSTMKQPSSAVTGAWTNSALAIAESSSNIYTNLGLKCIVSYMGGSFIAGLLNPYPMNYTMKRNTVRPSFIMASSLMYLSYFALTNKAMDGFCVNWMLCIVVANGIQNSITSTLTSNLMRSAHYSGMTSDIGTFVGQAMRGNKANGLKLKVFIVLAFSFWMGGYFSLGLVEWLGSKTLLLSAFLYLLFGVFSV
jgi:uncharacterized membrane protein YoaK (UPF0700 family)